MNELIDAGAVREIERLTNQAIGRTVTVDGREYSTVKLHDPRKPEPEPKTLVVATLQSFADYILGGIDGDYFKGDPDRGVFVHVASPTDVHLRTGLFGEHVQRTCVMTARAIVPNMRFEQFTDPESFNIWLQALFADSEDRDRVLSLVGNIQTDAVQTVSDDGVSQQVTAKRGVNRKANVEVPNPVVLRPYRTFREVEQPQSEFVLRMRGGSAEKNTLPSCALFEADGGLWELTAIQSIKAWLVERLGDACPVYG